MNREQREEAYIRSLTDIMKVKLRENRHKTEIERFDRLMDLFLVEVIELMEEVKKPEQDQEAILREIGDCANFLGMMAHGIEKNHKYLINSLDN